jgi:hypothetical protein
MGTVQWNTRHKVEEWACPVASAAGENRRGLSGVDVELPGGEICEKKKKAH